MVEAFDRIVIAVPSLQEGSERYGRLLGAAPFQRGACAVDASAWLGLGNTVIELVQREVLHSHIEALVFRTDSAGQAEHTVPNSLGLDIRLCDGQGTREFRREQREAQIKSIVVDHVVLRTDDAQACIDLFQDQLGIRLALDKTVPQWGGRMLFFRAGKLTLEIIQSDSDAVASSVFWGIAYQCPDLAQTLGEMCERGVTLSEVREGRKPGTRVATVKSHCLDIPTLLIQPATT